MLQTFLFLLVFISVQINASEPQLKDLKINGNFAIDVYARAENARSLALGPDGWVFVGTRADGRVYALAPDLNKDGRSDKVYTIASDLNMPNGVAFKNGDLYVAEISRIRIYRNIIENIKNPGPGESWGPNFPKEVHHGWKFIAFGPDGWLYVPVGAPCNVCAASDKYASIFKISPNGDRVEKVAQGVRNTVGFDWNPANNQLWFTDNGRDHMGDDIPPCELNRVSKSGEHFGFPYCHGGVVVDPEFGKGRLCSQFTAPSFVFPAHSAPLGLRFIKAKTSLKGKIVVAEHGSWNRSSPIGYQVRALTLDGDKITHSQVLITGFLQNGKAWGRPVDILELPDQSLLISDDLSGTIYRLVQISN